MTIELNPYRAGAMLKASAALLLSTAAMVVGAVPITVEYSGVVSRLWTADCLAQANGSCTTWANTDVSSSDFVDGRNVAVGSSFVGRFTYESTAPITAISSDGFQAVHLDSVYETYFQSGELALPSSLLPQTDGSFSVINNRPSFGGYRDSFFVNSWFNQANWFASLSISLQDSTASVFDSFDVPQTLDFADFNAHVFSVGFLRRSDGDQLQLRGNLTSVRVSPVPEPSSVALLLAGLGVLGGSIYRKRHVQPA